MNNTLDCLGNSSKSQHDLIHIPISHFQRFSQQCRQYRGLVMTCD